jgi:phosphoglucomutase
MQVDPTFRFMTVDWDGQIRMDPSSPYAMQRLIDLKDRFDIAFACDTDHDRHGIVTPARVAAAQSLPRGRRSTTSSSIAGWRRKRRSARPWSAADDRPRAQAAGRKLYEVPVGFKWFVDGLLDGSLASAARRARAHQLPALDGSVWTTDKDGIVPALLAAEITARMGRDPGEIYRELTREFGEPVYDRVEAPATPEQKELLAQLSPQQVLLHRTGRRKNPARAHPRAGQRRAHRRVEGHRRERMVRGASVRHRDIYKIYAESFRIGAGS